MKKAVPYLLIFIFLVLLVQQALRESYESHLLNDYPVKKTVGFLKDYQGPAVHSQRRAEIIYYANHRRYTVVDHSDFSFMKNRDSLVLEYSLKRPEVARVINKYFMKKHQHLRSFVQD